MIPVSLLLILVAVTLLVLGLAGGSSNLLIGSIGASLLAAVALVIGARQNAGRRAAAAAAAAPPAEPGDPFAADDFVAEPESADRRETVQFEPVGEAEHDYADDARLDAAASGARRDDEFPDDPPAEPAPDYERAADVISAARSDDPADEHAWRRADGHAEAAGLAEEFDEPDADDPADEPLPQAVRPADAVRIAQMDAEVLVVDGRPRYHVPNCLHLVGRLTEPIPVNEAVDLGFSPCGSCRPVDQLVAAAARH